MARDRLELLSDSELHPGRRRFQHLHKACTTNPCLVGFMFFSTVTLNITEISNDALLTLDVASLRPGLVYGQLDHTLLTVWLLFYSMSVIAMVFEILNIARYLIGGNPLVDLDLNSAAVVWLGETPTTATSIAISMCRSEPVSCFQLTKSLLVILSVILRIVDPIIKSQKMKDGSKRKRSCRNAVFQVITALGLCLAFCGAISVFIFTHVLAVSAGQLKFRQPEEVWSGNVTFERYFPNVGIYFHHEKLQPTGDGKTWLKLADIEECYSLNSVNVKVTVSLSGNIVQKLVINSYNTTGERFRECFELVQLLDGSVQYRLVNCTASFISQTVNTEQFVFRFVFLHPQLHLILGDISFNAKYIRDFSCLNISINDTGLYRTAAGNSLLGHLMYMKQRSKLLQTQRLVSSQTTQLQSTHFLLETAHELTPADEIWRTGLLGCDCSGRLAPYLDKALHVPC